jgi:hypothetical protein
VNGIYEFTKLRIYELTHLIEVLVDQILESNRENSLKRLRWPPSPCTRTRTRLRGRPVSAAITRPEMLAVPTSGGRVTDEASRGGGGRPRCSLPSAKVPREGQEDRGDNQRSTG